MMDSLNSTRKSAPTYVLKLPVQEIALDDLLIVTAEDLLDSVVTTLKDHYQRYASHLDQQQLLYSSYVKTMAKSQVPKLSTKTVTKSCNKSTSCKQPATFKGHTTQLEINKPLQQEAINTRKHASEYFLTTVDSRVCTQTAVSLSRINRVVVCQLSHPVISNIQRSSLLDLAWSCLVFLWEHLKHITSYPPIKSFLYEASETLATTISGNTATMNRLLSLFESDHQSIIFLCHAFQYNNQQQHSMMIQQYQRITRLIVSVQKTTLPASLSLSAMEYLIGSFDIDTWANSDTAKDETKRQEFYMTTCDFIRQQHDWDNNDINRMDCRNLVQIAISHTMTVMTTFIRKQKKEPIQGEHLYVLHLLLDTLATTYRKYSNSDTSSIDGLTKSLDTFIDVLRQQSTTTMITSQKQWKQQNRPEMGLEWTLLNHPDHILDTIQTVNAQIYTTSENQLPNAFMIYGPSGCMALGRLIFSLLLDPRIEWDFVLLVRCFELFWKSSLGSSSNTINTRQHSQQAVSINPTTDAQLYIAQLFGLSLELILDNQHNNNNATNLQTTLNDLHQYFYESLLYQVDNTWIDALLPALIDLPWNYLSLQHSDIMETILTTCIRLRKDDRPKYITYSTLIYSILQLTIIANNQQDILSSLDHSQFLHYVELLFILLMDADWIWPNETTRTESLENLWRPIINESGKLDADDMSKVIEITGIDDPSNWQSSLERQEKSGGNTLGDSSSSSSGDQDGLSICIRWIRHLTIVDGDGRSSSSMKLTAIFGRFILAHLKNVDNMGVQMNWLKVLLDQADEYMTKHDTTSEFNDCIDWFGVLIGTLLDRYQQQRLDNRIPTARMETVMETICEAIYTSNYSTTLAMFTACIPSSKPSSLSSTASPTSSIHSTGTLPYINFRLKVMECCLEHCLQLRHSDDVWLRVGTLLCDTYNNNKNMEATTKMVEASISEYIRHSMDLSFFLVLNGYCHAKLQQSYSLTTNDGKEATSNNDHHVAEEIAAILSMAQMDDSGKGNIQQAKKRMVLLRLFAHLLSKNKGDGKNSLDLWLASIVSLARTCTRWSTSANHSTVFMKDDGSGKKYHDHGWMTWMALMVALECFLASRLAIIGILPYSGMIPKDHNDNNSSTTKMAPWLTTLEQKRKKDISNKNLFNFAIGVIRDLNHWTLWELEDFILQLDGLSFGST